MTGVKLQMSRPIRFFGVMALAMLGTGLAGPRVYLSCTAFMLRADSKVVTGKNLDWPVGLGSVLLNPVGLSKTAWVSPPDKPAAWVSRYSSVTFNQFGQEFPLGGMNDAGLVVEELSYWPARYPARSTSSSSGSPSTWKARSG